MKVSFVVMLVVAVVMTGCQNPGGSSTTTGSTNSTLTKFGITGATGLVIVPASALARSALRSTAPASNQIFEVTSTGALLQVTSYDQTGAPMTVTMNPIYVGQAGPNYYLFAFGQNLGNISSAYLVRQSDGSVFQVPAGYLPNGGGNYTTLFYSNLGLVQTDSTGNLYWHSASGSTSWGTGLYHQVSQINVSDPSNLTAKAVNSPTDSALGFLVNPSGAILYCYVTQTVSSYAYRIKSPSGSLTNLPSSCGEFFLETLGGNFEYTAYPSGTKGLFSDSVSTTNGSVTTSTITPTATFSANSYGSSSNYVFRLNSEQYVAGNTYLTRVDSSNPLGDIPNYPLTTLSCAGSSASEIYLAGNDSNGNPKLIQWDPTNGFKTILPGSDSVQYDIYSMSVSASGNILFNALRMNDGVKVIGNVSPSLVTSVVDSTYNATIVSLLQIK